MDFLPPSLSALQNYRQFIIYKLVSSKTRPGKTDKLPVDWQTGKVVGPFDSQFHIDAQTAIDAAKRFGPAYGVGFVFLEKDPFWFLDIDSCLTNNKWSDIAVKLCNIFPGAAIEVSSSKKGLHIFGSGICPAHDCKNEEFNLEFYTTKRFVALTGEQATGNIALDFSHILPEFINNYFPATYSSGELHDWTTEPVSQWRGSDDDDIIISRALRSQSAAAVFGTAASFFDLWEANEPVLTLAYPDSVRTYDASSADAALAQHLAFWTGNNCERIERLMRRSKLARDKWEREDYLPRTILGACARQLKKQQWLCDKPTEKIETPSSINLSHEVVQGRAVSGNVILGAAEQLELFKGCVYVCDEHKVLVPGGNLLKPEQFRTMFGGMVYILDNQGAKTTRNAWEAFTESQIIRSPRADTTWFRPDLPPGQIIKRSDGRNMANIWWPITTPSKIGDPSLFLNHIKKLLPNEMDQLILISYLAALVQYKGVKFQYCIVLQGTPGNGKTLFNRVMAAAIGDIYSHLPKASEITEKYNDWLYRCLFVGVEDAHVSHHNREAIEILKPMITNERLEIRAMYTGKVMRDICCNFIFNINDKSSVPKARDDRRFAPLFTAQQSPQDLIRDGMIDEYFPDLYNWLNHQDGLAIINDYLLKYKIPPEFNPANKKPAPLTTSTQDAIAQGLSGIEQQIIEEVEQGTPGFKNGWISSTCLERLFDKLNLSQKIPLNRRQNILKILGYDLHPKLNNGRVNNIVMPDGNKPRLFVIKNHPSLQLSSAAEVAKAYVDDQKI